MKLIVEIPDRIIADLKAKRGVDIADTDLVFGALTAGKPYEERQTGEWVKSDIETVGSGYFWKFRCSLCNKEHGQSNYCPNCGAEMIRVAE